MFSIWQTDIVNTQIQTNKIMVESIIVNKLKLFYLICYVKTNDACI